MTPEYKIFLADLVNDYNGHYYFMEALSAIKNTVFADTKEKKILIKRYPIQGIRERLNMYHRVKSMASKYPGFKIVHLLTADKFYFIPFIRNIEDENTKFIATLHRVPSNGLLIKLLKNFAKKISVIVVLSDSLKIALNNIGINNVVTILHPSFYDYSKLNKEICLKKAHIDNTEKLIISALGGTRYDKGLDILIEALNRLSEKSKKKIILNIAGREQDFTEEYIKKNLSTEIERRICLRTLTNEEFSENIILSDWIALPYRNSFHGVSGPMVEALSQGIPIIVPKNSSLEYFAAKFDGCLCFESENVDSLSNVIELIASGIRVEIKNNENLALDKFINSHAQLYEKYIRGRFN